MNHSDAVSIDSLNEVVAAAEACQVRTKYKASALALNEALDRREAMVERAATMARARDAAQAEATSSRQKWSALLREADGLMTRHIQKLRASEHSALTLANEYDAIQQEILDEIKGMELDVSELADVSLTSYCGVVDLAFNEAFNTMVVRAADAIAVALLLYKRSQLTKSTYKSRPSEDDVRNAFLHRLGKHVDESAEAIVNAADSVIGVPAPKLAGVNMSLMNSPLSRARLRSGYQ